MSSPFARHDYDPAREYLDCWGAQQQPDSWVYNESSDGGFCDEQLGKRFRLLLEQRTDGTHTIADEMKEVRCKGLYRLKVQDKKGNSRHAVLELRYRRLRVLPP
ncbi:hypothetical protein KVP09_16460 [Alcaligenaceae bacterium CGII-47]|nr:hypothetical protein [Alcaligenaceae bacterium CGII-47]